MHLNENDLDLYLFERLGRARTALVSSHLARCVACAAKLGQTPAALHGRRPHRRRTSKFSGFYPNRRGEPRFPTSVAVTIQLLEPFAKDPLRSRLVDVSKSGMRFAVSEVIRPGTIVKVRAERVFVFGEVRHCSPIAEEFHVGIAVRKTVRVAGSELAEASLTAA